MVITAKTTPAVSNMLTLAFTVKTIHFFPIISLLALSTRDSTRAGIAVFITRALYKYNMQAKLVLKSKINGDIMRNKLSKNIRQSQCILS